MASARAPLGSMASVMSILFAAQTDNMTLLAGDLKEALKSFDKAPDVSPMGTFTTHPNNIGVSMQMLEDVRNFSNCASASNWPAIGSLHLRPRSVPLERYTPRQSLTARHKGTKP